MDHVDLSPEKTICLHFDQEAGTIGDQRPKGGKSDQKPISRRLVLKLESATCGRNSRTTKSIHEHVGGGNGGCGQCHHMAKLVMAKENALRLLSEDRDELKMKLTSTQNENIKLRQEMMKMTKKMAKMKLVAADDDGHKLRQRVDGDDGDGDGSDDVPLERRCAELEAINQHLQRH